MSIIAQVESSGTARGGGSGGSIGGGSRITGSERVARNDADRAEENSGQTTKNHFTTINAALVEASQRRRLSVTNAKVSVSPMLLDASITAKFDVANASCGAGLSLKTGAPIDSDAYGLHRFRGEVVAEIHIDRPRERDRSGKWEAVEIAGQIEGLDHVRFSGRGRDQGERRQDGRRRKSACPQREQRLPTSQGIRRLHRSPGLSPLRGPLDGLFPPTPLTTRRLQLNITRRTYFVI